MKYMQYSTTVLKFRVFSVKWDHFYPFTPMCVGRTLF